MVSSKNANNGVIFIKVHDGFELNELHDVSITTPVNWNIIRYDSVTSLWKNDVLPSGGGTVTSVAALTLGTTGTDVSSTVANGTTTPVITLNLPTSSATNRGLLSAADWSTFNSKLSSLPTASTTVLGGVKVDGTTITVDGTGTISAVGGGGGSGTVTTVSVVSTNGFTTAAHEMAKKLNVELLTFKGHLQC